MSVPRRTWKRQDKRELADKIAKLRADGRSLTEITKAVGRVRSHVCRIIRLFGIQKGSPNTDVDLAIKKA